MEDRGLLVDVIGNLPTDLVVLSFAMTALTFVIKVKGMLGIDSADNDDEADGVDSQKADTQIHADVFVDLIDGLGKGGKNTEAQ